MPGSVPSLPGPVRVGTDDAARILLVKAIEESESDAIAAERLVDVAGEAGDPTDASAWLGRRAEILLATDLQAYRPLLALGRHPSIPAIAVAGPAFLVGLASNYLDPGAPIHVLFNPVTLLIVWNLAAYAVLAVRSAPGRFLRARFARRRTAVSVRGRGREAGAEGQEGPLEDRDGAAGDGSSRSRVPWIARPLLRLAWRWREAAARRAVRAKRAGSVASGFASDWLEYVYPELGPFAARVLHLGAIGVVFGAFAGMYLRGLAFSYEFVWRSTFLTDERLVAGILAAAFGPAAFLIGQDPPGIETARQLMSETGMGAGTWIHLFAVYAVALVILPRAALAAIATVRRRGRGKRLELDFREPYFRGQIERARRFHVERVTREIRELVASEAAGLADRTADLVAEALYDRSLAPSVRAFRERGGRIADLKERLRVDCEAFRPELEAFLAGERERFESALASRIERYLGIDARPARRGPAGLEEAVRGAADRSAAGVGGALGPSLADPVAVAVSSAFAIVAGSLGGGFGHSLGTAVLVGLGATGPVGFLIGALAGLVAAGGAYWIGRERISAGLEQVPLPGAVVRSLLWENRLERTIADGRAKCREQVSGLLRERLHPLAGEVADEVWVRLKPAVGERLRAGVRDDSSRGRD